MLETALICREYEQKCLQVTEHHVGNLFSNTPEDKVSDAELDF